MLKFALHSTDDLQTHNPTQHHNAWATYTIPEDTKPEENIIVKQSTFVNIRTGSYSKLVFLEFQLSFKA